jgi:hypothetical protein
MNTRSRTSALVALVLALPVLQANANGFEPFFESTHADKWERDHRGKWYRKYTTERGEYIVTAWPALGSVFYRTWKQCPNRADTLDMVVWWSRSPVGLRIDCDGKRSEVADPQYWNTIINDLPDEVEALLRKSRMFHIPSSRMLWII